MRRPLVAGNWKMYKTVAEARHLVSELVPGLQVLEGTDRVLCPPFLPSWRLLPCWKARISDWVLRICTGKPQAPIQEKYPR
jgi:hypothetical protein